MKFGYSDKQRIQVKAVKQLKPNLTKKKSSQNKGDPLLTTNLD